MNINILRTALDVLKIKRQPIRLFYYNPPGIQNFGDQLNIALIEKYTSREVLEASTDQASYVCIGSLLEQFLCTEEVPQSNKRPLTLWGSGFISPPGEHPTFKCQGVERFKRPIIVNAVRGKLTLERIRAMGIDIEKVALGDPGLLAVNLLNGKPVKKLFRIGIIAHYVDEQEGVLTRMQKRLSGAKLLRITDPPRKLIAEMSSCEVIISSAMHGLIAADSLGIPNVRMKISEKLTGGDYKFRDYYSVYGINPHPLEYEDAELLSDNDVARIESEYKIGVDQVEKISTDLLNAIPF